MSDNRTSSKKCAFCGRTDEVITLLIPAQDGKTYICDSCIFACSDFLEEQFGPLVEEDAVEEESEELSIETLPRPIDIKAMLDDHVIGQDNAKLALAVSVYNHYKRILTLEKNDKGRRSKKSDSEE